MFSTNHLTPYLTLTGASYDRPLNGHVTSDFVSGGPDTYSGDTQINPMTYARFVNDAVTRFSSTTDKVFNYSIWNEPNLPRGHSVFLQLSCNDANRNKGRLTSDLYRALYQAAYPAAISAYSTASGLQNAKPRIYLGELTGRTQVGRPGCAGGMRARVHSNLLDYMSRVAGDPGTPIRAYGVSWHPYQHRYRPRSTNRKYGLGIGNIKLVQDQIASLNKKGTGGLLSMNSGAAPGLFLTEFGYFNRPPSKNSDSTVFHTEQQRASWYPGALGQAMRNGARTFMIYETVEETPMDTSFLKNPLNFGPGQPTFDVGLIGPNDGAVTGQRPYGKGGQQERKAYCAIHDWAHRHNVAARQNLPDLADECGP